MIVGRHPERASIRECLDAAEVSARFLVILGEAGVGKTTLISEACEVAESSGMGVLRGGATRAASDVPYGAVLPAIRQLVPAEALRGFTGTAALPKAALFDAMLSGCEDWVRERPGLMVIEDLHWSDDASLELLTIMGVAAIPRLVIAITVRDDEAAGILPVARLISDATRLPHSVRVTLGPFTSPEAKEFVALMGGLSAGVDAVLEHTGRVPLLLEEAVRRETEGLAPVMGHAVDILNDRVSRLDGIAKELVDLIAVRARPTNLDLAREILGVSMDDVIAGASQARSKAVLVDFDSLFDFRHARFAEAWSEQMLGAERRAWRQRIAEALVAAPGSDAAEVAAHWHAAGVDSKAREFALIAAKLAYGANAMADTLTMLELALASTPNETDEEGLFSLLVWSARCCDALGDYSKGIEYAERALTIARGGRDREIESLDLLGWLNFRQSQSAESRSAFDRALDLLDDSTPPALEARVLAGSVMIRMWETETVEQVAALRVMADRATRLAEECRDSRAVAVARLAMAASGPDDGHSPERWISALSAAEAASDPTWPFISSMIVIDLRGWFRLREACEWGERLIPRALSRGFVAQHAVLQALTAAAYIETGAWERAEELFRAARTTRLEGRMRFLVDAAVAEWDHLSGRHTEAEASVRALDTVVLDIREDLSNTVVLTDLEALIALARGDVFGAARKLMAVDRAEWAFSYPLPFVEAALAIRAGVDPGDPELVDAVHEELSTLKLEPFLANALQAYRLAEMSRLDGSPSGPWERAMAEFDDAGSMLRATYARLRLAEALMIRGERSEARAVWERGLEDARSMGAVVLIDQLEALGSRAGLSRRPTPDLPLTGREMEVLRLVASGMTNREIGEALFISPKTAGAHVSNIIAKLGVERRVEAAGVAHRLGWLDSTDRK